MDLILLFKAVVLGLVEGATEFIPVSSTGHLILAGDFLDWEDERAKTFHVFIQLGAILSVVWLYRAKIYRVVHDIRRDPAAQRFVLNLLVAFLPAAIVGFLLRDWIKAHLFNPITVAIALVAGGVAILIIEAWRPRTRVEEVDDVKPGAALGVGIAQLLALIPGISRSGATIMGAIGIGLSRRAATEFSFFLAIPVMFAATLYDLWESRRILSMADLPIFGTGFVVSFISALIIVKAFLGFVSGHTFKGFAWYRIIFGLVFLLLY